VKLLLGVSILALVGIIVAIVLASGAEPIDCKGNWSSCSKTCDRPFNVTTPQSGDGAECPTVGPSCIPGEGECTAEAKCQTDYKMSCEAANKVCQANYQGLNIT